MANQYTVKIRITSTEKECRKCGCMKLHSEFHRDSSNRHGLAYYCKTCANAGSRRNHKARHEDVGYREARRDSYFKLKYGLTLEQRNDMLNNQGFACAICRQKLPESGTHTHIDHCHETGSVREILCTNCNRGLGHFQDNPALLQQAAAYLMKHKGEI